LRPISLLSFILPPPPTSTLFPYTTLFRSHLADFIEQQGSAFSQLEASDPALQRSRKSAFFMTKDFAFNQDLRDREKGAFTGALRSEEHTSELQSLAYLVCRLLLEKKKYK